MSYSKTLRDVAAAEAGDAKAGKRLLIDADTVAQGGHSSGPIAAWNHRMHVETLAARLRTAVRAHRDGSAIRCVNCAADYPFSDDCATGRTVMHFFAQCRLLSRSFLDEPTRTYDRGLVRLQHALSAFKGDPA